MTSTGVIIGNCQTVELANILNMACPEVQFTAVQVQNLSRNDMEVLAAKLPSYSVLLSFPLSDNFGPISRARVTERSLGARYITNLHFDGLHPDFINLGPPNDRCFGPLGLYHSRIAFHAFMAGKNISATIGLFNKTTYDAFCYADYYKRSETLFLKRDQENDIQFAKTFFELARLQRALLTFNHPTTVTFVRYAELILRHLRADGHCMAGKLPSDPSIYYNSLTAGPALPVYPEIASQLGLPADEYIFKTPSLQGRPSAFIDLREFVEGEFAAFSEKSRTWLETTPQWAEHHRFPAL